MDDIYKKVAEATERKADYFDMMEEERPDLIDPVPMFKEDEPEPESEPFSFTMLTFVLLILFAMIFVMIDIINK
jgi:hypothetical protein